MAKSFVVSNSLINPIRQLNPSSNKMKDFDKSGLP